VKDFVLSDCFRISKFLPIRRSFQGEPSCDHTGTSIIANSCEMIYTRKTYRKWIWCIRMRILSLCRKRVHFRH